MASNTSLPKKLHLKAGHRALVWNAPDGYLDRLAPLPDGVELGETPEGTFDWVQLFVRTRAELDRDAPAAMRMVQPGGVLWVSYPKGSSRMQTDLTRDRGWDAVTGAGWLNVTQVSIDEVWSAARVKPAESVRSSRHTR